MEKGKNVEISCSWIVGKLLGNPGLQGQHAYLVVRTNKKKTSIKNLMT